MSKKISRPFYAKHKGILGHYRHGSVSRPEPWSLAMVAVYDVVIAKTPRIGKQVGVAQTSICDITRTLSITRPTTRKAVYQLIEAGYLRDHPQGFEVVNWNGTEPVGIGGGKNLTMDKNLPLSGKNLTTPLPKVDKNLPGGGKKLASTNRSLKKKKEEKRDKFCLDASEWFFSLEDHTKDIIADTLERLGKAYQKGKLNDNQKARILLRLKEFGPEVTEEACRRWNKRGYEKDAKRESYLYGIARGVEREWGVKNV